MDGFKALEGFQPTSQARRFALQFPPLGTEYIPKRERVRVGFVWTASFRPRIRVWRSSFTCRESTGRQPARSRPSAPGIAGS